MARGRELREFVDRDGERWIEVRPGRLVFASSREKLEERLATYGHRCGLDLDEVQERHGPLREVGPVTSPAADPVDGPVTGPVPSTIDLPATVMSGGWRTEFCVRRSDGGDTFVTIRDGRTGSTICEAYFYPAVARRLAYILLAAAGPGSAGDDQSPDLADPSTWTRYVDRDGYKWFEFMPGRAICVLTGNGGLSDAVRLVKPFLDAGSPLNCVGVSLDAAREDYGLRRA